MSYHPISHDEFDQIVRESDIRCRSLMIGSFYVEKQEARRQAGKHKTNCYFGCCRSMTKRQERRYLKRRETNEWKKDNNVAR